MSRGMGDNGGPKQNNWVAIDRDMRFHDIVGFLNIDGTPKNGPVSDTDAWFDLICEANWRDRSVNNKGRVVLIERGQMMGARGWLAARWGWSEKRVRCFLERLAKHGMISIGEPKCDANVAKSKSGPARGPAKGPAKKNTVNVITLCNYNIYQTLRELEDYVKGQQPDQQQGQPGASEGPHLNKDTRIQITTLDWRARENLDLLETKLLDACNGAAANPAVAPGILILTEPVKWLESGCDLELDILPTIRARAHKLRPGSIKNWSYFTQAVADAKAARETPMPDGQAPPPSQYQSYTDQELERKRKFMSVLENFKDG